ncbi:MAG: glycine--tRNA ligase subunit beta [SAR324 cluster bacterium]|nr:glycine--tRNA ligase subunit beta [SAR324 cluster bacterium]
MNTYLIEIGLEDMPAGVILDAVDALKKLVEQTCTQNKLTFTSLNTYSSPRRLAVLIDGLPEKQEDQVLEVKGPPANISKTPDGAWSKAALGFAQKNDIAPDAISICEVQGKEYLFARREIVGKTVKAIIQEAASQWVTGISFPKNMRWGHYKMRYVRPVRWLVSLWNNEILPFGIEMVQASNLTRGHRFLHTEAVKLNHASNYVDVLRQHHVIAVYDERRQSILDQIAQLEKSQGFSVKLNPRLVEEVTNLVEWPTVLEGHFEPAFLEIPAEVLVTTMATHQRYFPVYSPKGDLLSKFITVRNGDAHALDVIRKGNEKVLRARLSDARFFYLEDQKHTFEHFLEKSRKVVFLKGRGTLAQRTERIAQLSLLIAQKMGLNESQQQSTRKIAELCKFDLQTQLVYEFPDLQGVMGHRYARLKQETEVVSRGLEEHYYPRNFTDLLPQDAETVPVALADKLDMLGTAFSLGMIPSGSADPYALRRMAQGIAQILLGKNLRLNLRELFEAHLTFLQSQQNLTLDLPKILNDLQQFMRLRMKFVMQESGIRYDVIEAVLKGETESVLEQKIIADKLMQASGHEAFKRTVEAVVRTDNISRQQQALIPAKIDESHLLLPEEKALWTAILKWESTPLTTETFMTELFGLEPLITTFFENVMVMDKDPVCQQNRLFLCQSIASKIRYFTDLKEIVFSDPS